MKEENKQKAQEKKQQLKALSVTMQEQRKANNDERSINALLLEHYAQSYGTTELKTFDEWKASGYMVKKGAVSYAIWGKPVTNEEEIRDFYPIKHLFDVKQVYQINN